VPAQPGHPDVVGVQRDDAHVQSKKNPATMRRIHSAPGSSANTTQTGTTTIR
jgi:hypothetical protein